MKKAQIASFLQGLTGAQPVVVLAFLAVRTAMSLTDLESLTGKSNDSISSAVRGLEAKGLLVRQVGAHGKVFYLPVSASFYGFLGGQNPVFPDSGFQNPVFPDSGSVVVAGEACVLPLQQLTTTTTRGQSPVFPDSGAGSDQVAENLRAFEGLEIYGKMPRKVAGLPWVNPEYIRAHVEYARALDWPGNPEGYALRQMLERVPAPKMPAQKKHQSRYSDALIFAQGGEEVAQDGHVPQNDELHQVRARLAEIEALRGSQSGRVPDEYFDEWRALYKRLFELRGVQTHE